MGILNEGTIKRLEEAVNVLNGTDTEHLKTNALFNEIYSNNVKFLKKGKQVSKIKQSELSIEVFNKFVTSVRTSTLRFDTTNNIIRIIDDANNLLVFKGQMKQPFRDSRDVYCQVSMNNQEVPCTKDCFEKIIQSLKGDILILS